MRMTRKTFWVRRFVPAVLLFASLALALAAATARANEPAATISFTGGGHLVSSPLPGVTVTLKYDCVPPSPGIINVTIDEEGTAFGGTFLNATCDNKSHSVTVTVEGPFFDGVAAGTASLSNGSGGAVAMANQEINIK